MGSLGENKHNITGSTGLTSYKIVQTTVRDLFDVQHSALEEVRTIAEKQKLHYVPNTKHEEVMNALKQEKLEHEKTKLKLANEISKVQFAFEENNILKTQYQKEKEKYEEQIKMLQDKARRETKRSEFLDNKCCQAEKQVEDLCDEIALKNSEILALKKKLKMQASNHKQKLAEIDINKLQHDYMVKTLGDSLKN